MIPDVPLVLVYGANGAGKTRLICEHLATQGHPGGEAIFAPRDADLAFAAFDLADPSILADVASLYAALSPPLVLTLAPAAPIVAPPRQPEQARPLAHVSDTLARLLYPVTRATVAAHRGARHTINHPERDLSCENRAALARYLVRLAARPGARLIVETHEQTFMLAAQVAVARGEIPAAAVRIVQVERSASGKTTAQEIALTSWGSIGDGARDPNRPDFVLACEFARAARVHPDRPRADWETPETTP